jgi:hypothetical protein
MIRKTVFRAVVQNNDSTKNKYPLTVLSASCNEQYPFQIDTADIEVVSNSKKGTSGYALPIFSDNYIRLQVSSKINNTTWTQWKDLFIGQIQYPKSNLDSNKNSISLHCVGLLDETNWTEISETNSWSVVLDARDYLRYFLNWYRRNLVYSDNYAVSGVPIYAYNVTQNQTFLSDVIRAMEEQSAYTYRAYAVPTFDANQNISTIYLGWKPLSRVVEGNPFAQVTNSYAVIEGSWRYISSEFASSIEELRNRVTVIGSTTNGISGTKLDQTSINKYGKRTRIDTCNWINSTGLCDYTAQAILDYSKDADIYGTATILGTSKAHPGDLVYCKSPSQEVNGSSVEAVLPVYRVSHNISPSGVWTTSLDLGKINKDAYDYLGAMSRNIKTLQRNAVKC